MPLANPNTFFGLASRLGVCPNLSSPNRPDGLVVHGESAGNIFVGKTLRDQGFNFYNLFTIKHLPVAGNSIVTNVVRRGKVLKVVCAIVAFVSILMVDLRAYGSRTNEMLGDQDVNVNVLPSTTYAQICPMVSILSTDFDFAFIRSRGGKRLSAASDKPTQTPEVAYLVDSFPCFYGNPDFGGKIFFRHDGLLVRSLSLEPPSRSSALCGSTIITQRNYASS